MKILILTTGDHLYANQIVTRLLQTRDVVAVWESEVLLHNKNYLEALRRYWHVSGPDYITSQAVKQWIYKVGSHVTSLLNQGQAGNLFFSYKHLARTQGVLIDTVRDVNSDKAHHKLRQLSPDLIVSVYFNQLLKPSTIDIPPLGCINGHPAPLPSYKGVSPVFWALANGENRAGFTVHKIDKGIDTGKVLARKFLPINPQDTEHSLYWKLTKLGISLFDMVLDQIELGNILSVDNATVETSYYSLPTRQAVRTFRQNGKRFFRYSELLNNS